MADEKPADDVKPFEPNLDSLEEEQETPKDPSPKEEPKKEAKAEKEVPKEPEAETKEEAKTEPEEKETEEKSPSAEETVEETKPLSKGEERKTQLNSEIRDLVAQRNVLRTEIEKANAEVYAAATDTELLEQKNPETGENYSAIEAKVEAMRQATELRDYNDRVTEAQLTLESEANRVLNDFPVFNPESKDYDKELADEAAELLEANLIKDPNTGQIIGSNISPHKLYKTLARASGISATKGQIKGQEETEKMLANADAGGSSSPPAKEKDPLMDMLKDWDQD